MRRKADYNRGLPKISLTEDGAPYAKLRIHPGLPVIREQSRSLPVSRLIGPYLDQAVLTASGTRQLLLRYRAVKSGNPSWGTPFTADLLISSSSRKLPPPSLYPRKHRLSRTR